MMYHYTTHKACNPTCGVYFSERSGVPFLCIPLKYNKQKREQNHT